VAAPIRNLSIRDFFAGDMVGHTEYLSRLFKPGGQSCYLTGDLDKVLIIHGKGTFVEVSAVYFWCLVGGENGWK